MGRSAVRRSGPKHDFRQRLTLPNGRTVQARFTRDPCATHKYISISMRTCQGPRTRAPSAHGAGQALPQRSTLNALPSVVAIVGPTASGKTDTALAIARRFGGEIIVADSRQVYRGMDIGTNKAHGTWTMKHEAYLVEGIPYYGIDLVEPDETFTVQQWKKFAVAAIDAIVARKHLPVIEGGTGLYVTSLLDNWDIPEIAPDNTLRTLAENRIAQEGIEPIVKEILEADPDAAAFLDMKNPRRVIRAYEVIKKSGIPFSKQRRRGPKPYRDLRIGIDPGVAAVDQRIEKRAKGQFAAGLEDEVRALAERFGWDVPAMSGIGYAEWQKLLEVTPPIVTREQVLAENVRRNKQFARAQRKWFRRDPNIHWIPDVETAITLTAAFLA